MKYDFVTEVEIEQGYLTVAAQITISVDGVATVDWWEVEGLKQQVGNLPDVLREELVFLATDEFKAATKASAWRAGL